MIMLDVAQKETGQQLNMAILKGDTSVSSNANKAVAKQLALFEPNAGFSLGKLRKMVKLEEPSTQPQARENLPKAMDKGAARANKAILAAALENLADYRPALQDLLGKCAEARDVQKAKDLYFAQHAQINLFEGKPVPIPKRHAPEIPDMLKLLEHNENPEAALKNAEHLQELARGLIVWAKEGGWGSAACSIMKHATVILHLERVRLLAVSGDLAGAKKYYEGLKSSLAKQKDADTAAKIVAEELRWCFEEQVPMHERFGNY